MCVCTYLCVSVTPNCAMAVFLLDSPPARSFLLAAQKALQEQSSTPHLEAGTLAARACKAWEGAGGGTRQKGHRASLQGGLLFYVAGHTDQQAVLLPRANPNPNCQARQGSQGWEAWHSVKEPGEAMGEGRRSRVRVPCWGGWHRRRNGDPLPADPLPCVNRCACRQSQGSLPSKWGWLRRGLASPSEPGQPPALCHQGHLPAPSPTPMAANR